MTLKFSSSYGGVTGNYVIIGDMDNGPCDREHYGLYCVVENILQRGCPTNPSEFLISRIGLAPAEPYVINMEPASIAEIQSSFSEHSYELQFDLIMRYQILLLECLKNSMLDLSADSWKVYIESEDAIDIKDTFALAYGDLFLWISNIARLLKLDIRKPVIEFFDKKENADLCVNIRMLQDYRTVSTDEDIYILAADYSGKDYYEVASSDSLKYVFDYDSSETDNESLLFLLKNIFRLDSYRNGQLPIIKNILSRRDTIGILPTGTGKSLCYQLAMLLQPGVTVIIEPIIALMQDQKKSMSRLHIDRNDSISSMQTKNEKNDILQKFADRKCQCMWIAPERFQNADFRKSMRELADSLKFSMGVIDEVHCLSEWGHDFRVSYLALIKTFREYCKDMVLLGLTATASQAVLSDLKAEFGCDNSAVKAISNMDRPELDFVRIHLKNPTDKVKKIAEIINDNNRNYQNKNGTVKHGIGLVFCPTVGGNYKGCDTVYDYIKQFVIKDKARVAEYNGQMSVEAKTAVQNDFMNDCHDVLVCTKAFGMGIDKENIKYTIHNSLPQSIESFYQEAGRAGRDPDKSVRSKCYILYNPESVSLRENIQKIFNPNTPIAERTALSVPLKNDLNTIMYFWNLNRQTVEREHATICNVLNHLHKGYLNLNIKDEELQLVQQSLYKLTILGMVESWTLEYLDLKKIVAHVSYIGLDLKRIHDSLISYIRKYDIEFTIDNAALTRYKKYYDLAHRPGNPIDNYIFILIEWQNANILSSRLQSIRNMMELMDPSIDDKDFRARINEFFRIEEEGSVFDIIVEQPNDYDRWLEVIYEADEHGNLRFLKKESAIMKLASLQRYLESYAHNTGLNFTSGVLRLIADSYKDSEGEWRLKESLKNISEVMSAERQNSVFELLLKLGEQLDLDNKSLLSEALLTQYPDRYAEVYERLKDRYSMAIKVNLTVGKIKEIMAEAEKWNILID